MDFKEKNRYTIEDLLEIVSILRSPNGCPWDKKQTHESIYNNFIEETYEVLEAIDKKDRELLKEELGDVLLQVVFHSQLEKEYKNFSFDDVVDGLCKKLVYRHPHVFAKQKAADEKEAFDLWNNMKMKSKAQQTQSESMKSISKALPELMRAEKIQEKSKKLNIQRPKLNNDINYIEKRLFDLKNENNIEEIIGNMIFRMVNLAHNMGIDAQRALSKTNDEFISKVENIEHKKIKNESFHEYLWQK